MLTDDCENKNYYTDLLIFTQGARRFGVFLYSARVLYWIQGPIGNREQLNFFNVVISLK